jgi:hypothetical protein
MLRNLTRLDLDVSCFISTLDLLVLAAKGTSAAFDIFVVSHLKYISNTVTID